MFYIYQTPLLQKSAKPSRNNNYLFDNFEY